NLKAILSRALDRWLEPYTVQKASHVISVSPSYVDTLRARYPNLRPDQFTVLPFGSPEADFAYVEKKEVKQSIFRPDDGLRHWVYVGRGGDDMALTMKAIFLALKQARSHEPKNWQRVRLHFIGTQYAPRADSIQPIKALAETCEVGDIVIEK